MKNPLKRFLASVMLVCMMVAAAPAGQMISWAAGTRIAFSDPSVMVGNEVTVNMKITSDLSLGKADVMLSYDPAVLEFVSGTGANGGAGAVKVTGAMEAADQKAFAFTLKFKALTAGTTQITVISQEIYDADSQIVTVDQTGTSTVKVTSPAAASKDAALSSLKISPGVLTPEFSPEVDNYTAEVDGNTASLVVNAVAANAGASVALEGANDLQVGANQVVVRVTAEDKETVKTYTIAVNKVEGETTAAAVTEPDSTEPGDMSVTVGDTAYKVAAAFDSALVPEGFETSTYTYKGSEVMAAKGTDKDFTLLYLQDETGNGGFYIYNGDSDSFCAYVELEVSAKSITIVPTDTDAAPPDGYVERQIEIDGKRVTGWVDSTETEPQSCLFYGMNENGEKHFYRYDLAEMTVQRFLSSGVSNAKYMEMTKQYEDIRKDYKLQFYLLIALGVLALILLAIIVILLRRGSARPRPDRGGSRAEEDRYGRSETYGNRRESGGRSGGRNRNSLDDELKEAIYLEDEPDEPVYPEREPDVAGPKEAPGTEPSLEDMEKQLRTRLAREASQAEEADVLRKRPENPVALEEDEDDFEIMDLDD